MLSECTDFGSSFQWHWLHNSVYHDFFFFKSLRESIFDSTANYQAGREMHVQVLLGLISVWNVSFLRCPARVSLECFYRTLCSLLSSLKSSYVVLFQIMFEADCWTWPLLQCHACLGLQIYIYFSTLRYWSGYCAGYIALFSGTAKAGSAHSAGSVPLPCKY
jgi:hypothetical protein